MIKVLIADDHAIIRRGVRDILKDSSLPMEVDEVHSAQETLKAVTSNNYDILLLDISFPDGNGLDVFHQAHTVKPDTRVLFLSMYPEEQYARRVLKAGAYGYLTKDSASDELIDAIEKVICGKRYVSLNLVDQLADALVFPGEAVHEMLSDREFQVMLALAGGKSISEIAFELSLSPKTVSTYRTRVLKKLKLKTTAQLIRYVLDHGLGG